MKRKIAGGKKHIQKIKAVVKKMQKGSEDFSTNILPNEDEGKKARPMKEKRMKMRRKQKATKTQRRTKSKKKIPILEMEWSTCSSSVNLSTPSDDQERGLQRMPGSMPIIALTAHVDAKTRKEIKKMEFLTLLG